MTSYAASPRSRARSSPAYDPSVSPLTADAARAAIAERLDALRDTLTPGAFTRLVEDVFQFGARAALAWVEE